MNSKMSRIIIILATITLASYGKALLCRSTYDVNAITQHQYNNSINCANQKCLDAVDQFKTAAEFTINKLALILNKEEFKFRYNVSLMTVDLILFCICINTLSQRSLDSQRENVQTIMKNFTPACQRYSDVMAHKHHLQHLLFNENQLTNATVIIQLALVIIKLQIMANSLETAQVCVYSCVCYSTSQSRKYYRLKSMIVKLV